MYTSAINVRAKEKKEDNAKYHHNPPPTPNVAGNGEESMDKGKKVDNSDAEEQDDTKYKQSLQSGETTDTRNPYIKDKKPEGT